MNRKGTYIKPASYAVLLAVLFTIPLFIQGQYPLHVLIIAGINIILASSLRLISTTGQISLAHAGFMAIGAYTSALLMMKLGLPFWITLLAGGMASALVALLVGYPFVRVKRVYFAMLTLFLGQLIRGIIAEWRSVTSGTSGLLDIPAPDSVNVLGLFNIVFDSKVPYYYLILIIMLLSLLVLYRIDSTRVGKTMLAIQQGDYVAQSIGVNTNNFKVFAWCMGCFFAGIAGSFYAHYLKVLTPDTFGVFLAIYIVVYMIVGGTRLFWGAAIGAFILTLVPEFFRPLQEFQPYVFVAVLLLIIFLLPGGLADLPRVLRMKIKRFREAGSGNA